MSSSHTASMPAHVGIIMDGNGRWARLRGVSRTEGHRAGLEAARRLFREASAFGPRVLTLCAFSTEDWRRPRREVALLFSLIRRAIREERDFCVDRGLRILHTGEREGLPEALMREIDATVAATAHCSGPVLNLAVNYGGRDEIVRSVNRWLSGRHGRGRCELSTEELARHLDQPQLPDADLIIRTGREKCLSSFPMWESSYAELVFSPKLWPDFGPADLRRALREYAGRERRFGRTP